MGDGGRPVTRFLLLAAPSGGEDKVGTLDGDAIRSRLLFADTGFSLLAMDPARDLADQVGGFFDVANLPPGSSILFYVSATAVQSVDREVFLCFDPTDLAVGDSLHDIALTFKDHAKGPVAFLLDLRDRVGRDDPKALAGLAEAARAAVASETTGIELIVSVRSQAKPDPGDRPSPLTRSLLEVLDTADTKAGLAFAAFYGEALREGALKGLPLVRAPGRLGLALVPAAERDPKKAARGAVASAEAPGRNPLAGDGLALAGKVEPKLGSKPPVPTQPKSTAPVGSAPPASGQAQSGTAESHTRAGDDLLAAGDAEGALQAYRRALGLLSQTSNHERADLHARSARAKKHQGKPREAIANFEKALALLPGPTEQSTQRALLEELLELNVSENDLRGLQLTEDRLLAAAEGPDRRFVLLTASAARWKSLGGDPNRALQALERAREIRPNDLQTLEALRDAYTQRGAKENAFSLRRQIADLTEDARTKAERYFELSQECLSEAGREDLGLELAERALASDPTLLDPLAVVARVLADRQEWSELAGAYRRMLDRVERIPKGPVRTEVTFELCVRMGVVFRDHLEDFALSLDAFEDALEEKPADLRLRLASVELARKLAQPGRALTHLVVAAASDPRRIETFHHIFEFAQKARLADRAYHAAAVTTCLGGADSRERFIFEENRPEGLLKFASPLVDGDWELLADRNRDVRVEAVLSAVAPAAIGARIAKNQQEGTYPAIDPATRVDPEQSTLGVVRAFVWASHFLGLSLPAMHLSDDPDLEIAAIAADPPAVFLGQRVLAGRTLAELAFLSARHLAFHTAAHRLLLYFPSLDELSECFVAAVQCVRRREKPRGEGLAAPSDLEQRIGEHLTEEDREKLTAAVRALLDQQQSADLGAWVAAVERCSLHAGYLLSDDLDVARRILAEGKTGSADAKLAELLAFAVSEELYLLRDALGVAVQP